MSFRLRLVLVLLAVQALLVAALVGGDLALAQRESRAIALADLRIGAALAAQTLAEPAGRGDAAGLGRKLGALTADGTVSYAAVHDDAGRLLSAVGTLPAGQAAEAAAVAQVQETGQAAVGPAGAGLRALMPLRTTGATVGVLELHVPGLFRPDYGVRDLLLAGVALAVLAASFLGLPDRPNRRLSALEQATRRLADGDPAAEAEIAGDDDALARTAARFNRMAEDLAVERARLEKQARQDHLTRIPNRFALEEFLAGVLDQPGPERALVMHVDLDGFGTVNEVFGHRAGDQVLRQAAQRLAAAFGQMDGTDPAPELPPGPCIAARTGGDEFMVVMPCPEGFDALAFAERLIQMLSVPLRHGIEEIAVGASIGVVTVDPAAGESLEEVLHAAGTALRAAKTRGRNRAVVIDDALRARALADIRIVKEIERGLLAREFVPHFQPQFSIRTGAITGFELLARWRHPDRGLLPPGAFLNKLHDPELVERVDRQVRQAALRSYARLLEAYPGLADTRLGLNLPQSQLGSRGIVEDLELAIEGQGLATRNLAIEVLESVLLDESNLQLHRNMARFSELGFSVELDDFGTGHSSFSNLMHFRIDRIKIDRSFLDDVDTDPARRALLSAMVGVGRALGIEVLAEGVETQAQMQLLREMGCDAVQGYLLARPMDIHQLQCWLAGRGGAARAAG